MTTDEKSNKLLSDSLKTENSREKFLELLDKRIEENRKSLGGLFVILILCALSFNLLLQTKISEINIGPLKINDNKVIFALIPTIFTFVYYKYIMIWVEISEQKRTYNNLTSIIFEIENNSTLNNVIKPFSITDSIFKHQENEKGFLGCLTNLFWIPIGLFMMFIPFVYEYYLIDKLVRNLKPTNFFEWFLFICPIIISIYTIITLINVVRNGLKK